MKHRGPWNAAALVTLIGLLAATAGCNPLLANASVLSGVTGWLLGHSAAAGNIEQTCYQNGVQVDCATLPADIAQ